MAQAPGGGLKTRKEEKYIHTQFYTYIQYTYIIDIYIYSIILYKYTYLRKERTKASERPIW